MILNQLLDSLSIDVCHAGKISGYLELFEKWNRRINLSGAGSRSELWEHVEDCLHVVPHLTTAKRILDVGSGGGFPVVLAAICLPSAEFVALEPVHKKHAFLNATIRELSLRNFAAKAERLEDHSGSDYDAATCRATFDLQEWLSRGKAYVTRGGKVIGFEGVRQPELEAVSRYPYQLGKKCRSIVIALA